MSCNYVSRQLSLSDVRTLFHEFGHAMHWMLSRTEVGRRMTRVRRVLNSSLSAVGQPRHAAGPCLQFQHMSGTRGPSDFMEIPSHIFELFAMDPRVLRTFARHRETGEVIPDSLVEQALRACTALPAMSLQVRGSPPDTSTSVCCLACRAPWLGCT